MDGSQGCLGAAMGRPGGRRQRGAAAAWGAPNSGHQKPSRLIHDRFELLEPAQSPQGLADPSCLLAATSPRLRLGRPNTQLARQETAARQGGVPRTS